MEGSMKSEPEQGAGVLSAIFGNRRVFFILCIYLLSVLLMSIFGGDYISFRSLFLIWTVLYLLLIYLLLSEKLTDGFDEGPLITIILIIFLGAFIVHIPFIFQEPMLSQDIFRMERRGELFLDGNFPYQDFNVNKPPLYIWMVGLVSLVFGPDQMAFRVIFTLVNCMVPLSMILVHRSMVDRGSTNKSRGSVLSLPSFTWMDGAIAYALCPVPILETALGGHFDPLVVLMTVLAFLFLIKNQYILSGLFLGTGFSLKLYPMFIAPVFFLAAGKWKDRFVLLIGFFTVPVLSSIPIMIRDPSLMVEYLRYQFLDWFSGFSLRYGLEYITELLSGPEWFAGRLMMILLITVFLLLVIRGILRKSGRLDVAIPFALMYLLTVASILLSSLFIKEGADSGFDLIAGYSSILLSILLAAFALYIFIGDDFGKEEGITIFSLSDLTGSGIPISNVALISSGILVMVIFTSSQFHPWYIAWVLPFILASGSPQWIWSSLITLNILAVGYYPPWEAGHF